MVYLGDNWPDIYRNQVFTHNIFGRQLNRGHNVRDGAGYETFDGGYDLMFTPDPTYLGVSIQYGPDGAAYISDWADLQQCHSPQEGAWDRSNGRIYRLAWSDTWKAVRVNLVAESDTALVARLGHKNAWYGRTARRLLQERAANGSLDPAARSTLEQQAADASNPQRQLEALWTLHVTGSLDRSNYEAALANPHEVVRAWAVQLGTEQRGALQLSTDSLLQSASDDPSQMVRLAIASALPMLPTGPRWDIATALAAHAEDASDRFLPKVVWSGLAPLIDADPNRALELAASTPIQDLADSIRWSTARTPAGREALTAQILESPAEQAARSVRIMAFALQQETALAPPAGWTQAAARLNVPGTPEGAREATEQLSVLFGDEAALARARARLADNSLPEEERLETLRLLKQVGDTASVPIYLKLLDQPAFRSAVIPLLASTDDPAIAQELIERYPRFSEEDRAAASEALVSRPKFALALLEAVRAGTFDGNQLSAFHVRQLNTLQDPQVEKMLAEVWGRTAPSSSETRAAETRYTKLVSEAPMWAYSMEIGQDEFVRICGACHVMDGAGTGQIGPNLTGSSRHGNSYFIESIVDPNAVVGLAFQLNVVALKDGSVVSGTVDSETGSALVLRTLTDRVTVQKSQIAKRDITPQSMMPAGLLDTLSSEQVIHLFKFLTKAGG
jgi:putative heme-binding domain-containing protein